MLNLLVYHIDGAMCERGQSPVLSQFEFSELSTTERSDEQKKKILCLTDA